ncbi:MAG: hypothetical protein VX246_02885 [Myxococcota bacterium]|nr:hypothetical protein [Myxococcota bacterium]
MTFALPAASESPTPFSPEWAATIEDTFFDENGDLSIEKHQTYRKRLEQRHEELVEILSASYRESGKKKKKIAGRIKHKKEFIIYRLVLGSPDSLGLLDQLWDETDPDEARRLAADILEIDYALQVEGERPFSLNLIDYISWASVRHWVIEPKSNADEIEREASNLWNPVTGQFYSHQDLREMLLRGEDLGALDPPPTSGFWQPGGAIAERSVRDMFYGGNTPVHRGRDAWFPKGRAELAKIRKSQTKPKFELEVRANKTRVSFKLKVGGEIHSEPTVNALLATLGFNVDLTRYVRDFRLDLGDTDLEELRHEWRSYFENHRTHLSYDFNDYFVEGEDEQGRFLIVREGVLEWKPRDIIRVGPWPSGANGNEGRREARALGLFSAWVGNTDLKEAENNKIVVTAPLQSRPKLYHLHHDIGHSLGRLISEQLEAFPWELVERTPTGKVYLNYHSVQRTSLRTAITYADARWMTRQIAQLSRRQIAQAVHIGHWPRAAGALLTEKLIHRRNQLVEAFDLVGAPSPSGPIQMMPVDREITTADGSVVDGEFVDGEFEFSTQQFANYWEELLGPVFDKAVLFFTAQIQRGIGQVPELIFDPRSAGIPRGLVTELLVNFKRQVEENRHPTSASDYYLTRDTFLLGARLGAGYVGRGEVAYQRKYTLITTSGTKEEAHYADNTALNLLLPWNVYKNDLPDNYTLIREDFLEGRGRVITDDLSGGSVPAGAEATWSRIRLSRDVISVRDGKARAYRDLSVFDQAAFRAFAKLVFVRIPLVRIANRRGTRTGDLYRLDEAFERSPNEAQAALSSFIRSGDPDTLDAITDRLAVDTEFHYSGAWAGLLDFIWHREGLTEEIVRVSDPLDQHNVSDAFTQLRVYGRNFWSFLDFAESYRWAVRSIAPSDASAEADDPVITIRFVDNDRNTTSSELGEGYLGFINGVADAGTGKAKHRDRIPFTPELHSVNGLWGHLYSTVDVGFSSEAVVTLVNLESQTYWTEFAKQNQLDIPLAKLRNLKFLEASKRGMALRRRLPLETRRRLLAARDPIRNSTRVLAHLKDAKTARTPEPRYRAISKALGAAAFRRGDGFDPRVLAVLRSLADSDEVSVDARITPPPWVENRLLANKPLVLHTHKRPFEMPRRQIIFQPSDAAQVYDMLESFDSLKATSLRDTPEAEPAQPEENS